MSAILYFNIIPNTTLNREIRRTNKYKQKSDTTLVVFLKLHLAYSREVALSKCVIRNFALFDFCQFIAKILVN